MVEQVRHADGALSAGAWVAPELGDAAGLPSLGVTVAGEGDVPIDLALGAAPEDGGRQGRGRRARRLAVYTDRLLAGDVGGRHVAGLRIEVAAIGGEVLTEAVREARADAEVQVRGRLARAADPVRETLSCHLLEVALDAYVAVVLNRGRRRDEVGGRLGLSAGFSASGRQTLLLMLNDCPPPVQVHPHVYEARGARVVSVMPKIWLQPALSAAIHSNPARTMTPRARSRRPAFPSDRRRRLRENRFGRSCSGMVCIWLLSR